MNETTERTEFMGIALDVPQPNDLGYYELLDWRHFRPLSDRILVDWDFKKEDLLAGKLVRPDTHTKMQYTGIVLAIGPKVQAHIEPGMRIMFDQFSNFDKMWNQEIGRLALISESAQASAFAIIPYRLKVGNGQGDYNYEL